MDEEYPSEKEAIVKSLFFRLGNFHIFSRLIASGSSSSEKATSMKAHNLRALWLVLLPILLAALIGMACSSTDRGMPTPVTPLSGNPVNLPPTPNPKNTLPTETVQPGPCRFSVAGNYASGWYWLRDEAYATSGQWDCRGLPVNQDLTISLQTLVTNQADGGSGYSSPVKITYTNPTSQQAQTIQVYLQNPLADQSPANSRGVGYPTTGYFVIPKAYIDTNGGLSVRLERFQPNTFHVAVDAESLNFDRPHLADSFNQWMGTYAANWYWLRDTAHQAYSQWTFNGLNPTAPATLVFDILVTNKAGGGSGYSTPIEVTLINPANSSQKTLQHVIAENLLFTQDPNNSDGAGYQTYASLALDAGIVDANGNLIVRVARLQDATNHLAVNQYSAAIIQPEFTQELETPSPTVTLGQDGLDTTLSGKYLFIQYWNNVAGTGKLPALAIDFPDYRFDPTTGTLSSFNPSQSISLAQTDMGFIGHGTSRSGDAGTGAVSSLNTINQVPYSIDVAMFTGAVNLKAGPNMEETKAVAAQDFVYR